MTHGSQQPLYSIYECFRFNSISMRDRRGYYHGVLVTYFITRFWNPLRSVLLPANLSSPHILSLSVTLSVPLKPGSPSLSVLPFLSHSSHSVPLFDEKPVKVAPAAVQTQMDPRSVCAQKDPPNLHPPYPKPWTLLCLLLSQPDVFNTVAMAPRNEGAREEGRWLRRGGICIKIKRKEGYRQLGRNYKMREHKKDGGGVYSA